MARRVNVTKIDALGTQITAKEQYYMGNKGLPTAESEYEWTPEMIAAMKRCSHDLIYFASNFFTIIDKTIRKIIDLRDYQIRILRSMENHNRLILNTSRQVRAKIPGLIFWTGKC